MHTGTVMSAQTVDVTTEQNSLRSRGNSSRGTGVTVTVFSQCVAELLIFSNNSAVSTISVAFGNSHALH